MLNVFPALSTDMYLPALPTMIRHFDAPLGVINLTLVLFFVFYAASMLLWGPLSDKYGRKRILLVGTIIYTLSSILCGFSGDVYQLILGRVFQAIGAGTAVAVSTAITKDVYGPREREKILAVIATLMMIGPIIAPIVGAWMLTFTSWRGQFFVLAGFGVVALTSSAFLRETITVRTEAGVLASIARLGVVLKNRSFTRALLLFAFLGAPLFTFIGLSSAIFVDGFGVSEQVYSLYFAANGVLSAVGPSLYLLLSRYCKRFNIISLGFSLVLLSGLLLLLVGGIGPGQFIAAVMVASIGSVILRVPSMNLILEQIQSDAGSASSLISGSFTMIGGVCLMLASLGWGNLVYVLGAVNLTVGVYCLARWTVIRKKNLLIDTLAENTIRPGVVEPVKVRGE